MKPKLRGLRAGAELIKVKFAVLIRDVVRWKHLTPPEILLPLITISYIGMTIDMVNILNLSGKIVLSLILWLIVSCSDEPYYEQFFVGDVSKEHQFMDTKSAASHRIFLMDHVNMRYSIEGQLDSSATVLLISYPRHNTFKKVELAKGQISMINYLTDYYEGDTILVRFIPKGSQKGHLKIRTRIN